MNFRVNLGPKLFTYQRNMYKIEKDRKRVDQNYGIEHP